MPDIPAHFMLESSPQAEPAATVTHDSVRITVLTPRLLRMEFSPQAVFEDRASQVFWHRRQPVPQFKAGQEGGQLWVETAELRLSYRTGQPFRPDTLSIELLRQGRTWRFGDSQEGNLLGTARTLDSVDGGVPLEPGLISRDGWVLVDDSQSLVFNQTGWLEPRRAPSESRDLYFFGYGWSYQDTLRDFRRLAGPAPLLPRWALGNWWSRYWEYDHDSLCALVEDFERHAVPLAVCILDMDWHITQTGTKASGWTGYTWNRALFPRPEETIAFLHAHGLKTALNLHPAEGVHPHEIQYPAFAERMGIDPAGGQPIPFDPADPRFAGAYFELLHHPEEQRGVDFWWIDWQQGIRSKAVGLDPLWWLNHLHFMDLARPTPSTPLSGGGVPGVKRGLIFSRWGGLGNHRYPIGFSGDAISTWESLAFQPYFTATAANVGYDWWSHDIGGHFGGIQDPELYTRWVQFGTLSPILRLHSTKNAMLERRPFGYDPETFQLTCGAMQFRHRLIPYLYSLAWRDHSQGEAAIRPMYHEYPAVDAAYSCPDQYTFGPRLIAAPHIRPRDPLTGLARAIIWLPEEAWHFFDGSYLPAGWYALYGDMADLPLFARPGAIVPLCDWHDWRLPEKLEVHLFPGASNLFELYEDDGETSAFLHGRAVRTPIELDWQGDTAAIRIGPAGGDRAFPLGPRRYRIVLHGLTSIAQATAELNGRPRPVTVSRDGASASFAIEDLTLQPRDRLTIRLDGPLIDRSDGRLAAVQRMVRRFRIETTAQEVLHGALPDLIANPAGLAAFRPALAPQHLRALLEVILQAGVHQQNRTGEETLVLWNNRQDGRIRYQLSTEHHRTWHARDRLRLAEETVPAFLGLTSGKALLKDAHWNLRLRYAEILDWDFRGE